MKYLEDDKLTQLTLELTDAALGGTNCRVINGRIEAFTMKRAGTDKKYAHALGERYVAEMEVEENQLATYQQLMQRHAMMASKSAAIETQTRAPTTVSTSTTPPRSTVVKRSLSVGNQLEARKSQKQQQQQQRSRASSFDSSATADSASGYFPKSALGDFHEMGTRRLMTDLILTLNASFPDYDFGDVRPSHFSKIPFPAALRRTNERLSELAGQRGESFLSNLWNSIDKVITLSEADVYSYIPPARDDEPFSFLTQTLLEEDYEATPLWSFNYFFVNKHLKRILFFCCVETMHNEVEDGDDFITKTVGYTTESDEVNFDMDPAADVAGGIPLVTSS